MKVERQIRKCHFHVSEPYEYGFEDNLRPLSLDLIGSALVDSKISVLLIGSIRSKGAVYSAGLASARYVGEEVTELISSARGCTVNAMFFRERDLRRHIEENEVDEIVTACLAVPMSDRLLLIGNIHLA